MAEEEPAIRRRRWPGRLLKWGLGLVLGLLLLAGGVIAFLDTGPGHRFIADRIAQLSPSSGLKIRIGRIEGSIWNEVRLRDVRIYDPEGLFAESPLVDLDWRPAAWMANRLSIDSLESDLVVLHRLPRLRPSETKGPILPGFDIRIGRLAIDQFRFEKGVAGERRSARVLGSADIRSGRARIQLAAAVRGSGERLRLALIAEPDRERFDVDLRLHAPANSVTGALVGTERPIDLLVEGDGSWRIWKGRALLDLSGSRTAALALEARDGRYSLSGRLAPSQFLRGKGARLTAPHVDVAASATLANRRLDSRVSLRSAALKIEASGVLDLAESAFDGVRIGADLLRPPALFPNMTGNRVRFTALLDGPFGTANFAYRLSSPHIQFDNTGFDDFVAEGRGRWSKAPVTVPIRVSARRVTGVGAVAGGILANLRVQGALKVTARQITGEGLDLTSDRLKGRLGLFLDLVTGRYDVVLSGGLTRYLIPGLGIVDVTTNLKVVPDAGGRGSLVTGTGKAWVRRFDNRFLAGLAGGLPVLETGLIRGRDGILHFRNLRIRAPEISIDGNGYRRRDGTFHFEGSGTQQQYGPFSLTLDGRIDRPTLAIRLERPMDGLGLSDVLINLDPTADGFAYRAEGGSTLGPFTSRGAILLPSGEPAVIEVAAVEVSGTSASGRLRSDPGGFTGRLDVSGGGMDGRLLFSPVGEIQRIEAHLTARDARFAGPPAILVQRGQLDGVVLLDPGGTSIEATASVRGLRRGTLSLARLDGQARLRGGSGQLRLTMAGARGRSFALETLAEVAPGRISVRGKGTVDRRPIALTEPAVFTRVEDGWRLARTSLTFAGGKASVSGLFGERTEVGARLDAMPLTVLDIAFPQLGLGGTASGTLNYRAPEGGLPPTGDLDMRVRGLTRSGLVLSSRPVDVGIVAKLDGVNAAMRAVAASEGRTIGRAQARISPIGGSGTLMERLSRAPLFAQLRYNGSADTLWRLTGLELVDLSGPASIGADATGSLNDPVIRGSIRTEQARLESPVLGTVVENVRSSGRFDGSRFVIDSFSGTTKNGGKVTARGAFDLAAARGFGIDLAIQAEAAQLIDRDDIKAQVTGPIRIKSDGSGGLVSGEVDLVSGSFKLGSATAAGQVPRLDVTEINLSEDELPPPQPADPWRLDMGVKADNRLIVTGLGINSEWGADLRIAGTVTAPRISGQADLIRGTYDFAGRRFDLERGAIRFQGESPPNPILDIVAEGGIQGLNATIRVTGRGQRPEIAFTSTPAMPQDELLSRLLFGTSITNLSAAEALQLASAVAALNDTGGGLDPINAVRSAVGLDRLRILPADVVTGQGTSIAAGKYIGRRVYVEVITDARGYSATRLEYQISRWLSILSTVSTIGRQSVNVRVSRDY